jgi:hypothetical protein
MKNHPRAFRPKERSIEVTVWTISMRTKDGKEMVIAGSTKSEEYGWKLFRSWQKSNESSPMWDWSVPPRVEKKSYLKVVRN